MAPDSDQGRRPRATPDAKQTRARLIDAATRAFAEQGIHAASLLDITRKAGQRNRGAVHYHFGFRDGLLAAVLEQEVDFIAAREAELLTLARSRAEDNLPSVVEAFVRPSVELADRGWRGRCYRMVLGELVEHDPDSLHPQVVAALQRTRGYDAFELLGRRAPPMPEPLRTERLALVVAFILRATADRARSRERLGYSRAQLPTERFVANLVAMVTAMLAAPVPDGFG